MAESESIRVCILLFLIISLVITFRIKTSTISKSSKQSNNNLNIDRPSTVGSTSCRNITSIVPSWKVIYCETSSFSGSFTLISSNASGYKSRFRGRIVGSSIQNLNFERLNNNNNNNNNTFIATYHLPAGDFIAHVDLRYDDFDIDSFYNSTIYSFNPIFQFNFTLPSKICKRNLSDIDSYWTTFKGSHPILPPQFMLGAQPNVSKLSEELRLTFADCTVAADAFLRNSVRIHPISIIGDSQGRHLTTAMVEFIDDMKFYYASIRTDKTDHSNKYIKLVYDPYSYCFLGERNEHHLTCPKSFSNFTSHSDILLLNFGQWQIGWTSKPPWTLSRYLEKVHKTMARATSLFPSKRVIWLTMHPYGEFYDNPQREWRNDIVLKDYNEATVELCQRYGYEYIDIFRVSNVVHDLAYDGSHYKSPVEREIVRVILHSIFA